MFLLAWSKRKVFCAARGLEVRRRRDTNWAGAGESRFHDVEGLTSKEM